MEAEIFEALSTALLNLDDRRYISVLSSVQVPLLSLLTPEHNNSTFYLVFHELSLNIAKEDHLLNFYTQACTLVLPIQLESDPLTLSSLINQQNLDGKTPLHLAIMTGRRVTHN
jgi:ankyrin repeat protein